MGNNPANNPFDEGSAVHDHPTHETVQACLHKVMARLEGFKGLRHGSVLLRLHGEGGGDYCVESTSEGLRLASTVGAGPHLLEIMGEARRIVSILEGKSPARAEFLAGGIQVKGDLHHLSDLALELGLIKQPL